MSQPRKREWEFPVPTSEIAREFRVPGTRVYNALIALGLKRVGNEDQLNRLAIYLTTKGAPIEALIKVFGAQITLGQLLKQGEEMGLAQVA